ncbi:MAG: recombinase family protein [Dehalococcoidia bacterium]
MNNSINLYSSDSSSQINSNDNQTFVFKDSLELNPVLLHKFIISILDNKNVNKCVIHFPVNINKLFWELMNLSNFLNWIGVNVETIIPNPIDNKFKDHLSSTYNKVKKSTLEYFQQPASEGKVLGRIPFGYVKDIDGGYKIYEPESIIIKEIFSLYVNANYGLRKIAAHLNIKDIKTRKGNPWNIASLRLILTNPIYMGTYRRYRFTKLSNHQPIIDSSIFRNAQDIIASRSPYRKLPKKDFFLLSGLAKCGYCKNSYVGVQKHQYWKTYSSRVNKGSYKYYKCLSNLNENICMSETRSAEKFESNIIERIISSLPTSHNLTYNIFYNLFSILLTEFNMKEYSLEHPEYSVSELLNLDFISNNTDSDLYNQILDAWKSNSLLTFVINVFSNKWDLLSPEIKRLILKLSINHINVYQNQVRVSI